MYCSRQLDPSFLVLSFLNAWIGYSITHTLHSMSVLPALVIALASLLQAAIGGAGLSRLIGYPAPLDNPPGILLYEAADRESWSRKSEQDDKWSFCLTAGTLCPANQERP